MEFSFDVVQVAAGAYTPEAYHSYIGFKVAKPALERAFRETYGIEMKDVFFNEDLAIATYRHAIGTTIPEMTKVAWSKKRDEIMKVTPGMQREDVRLQPAPQRVRQGVRRRLREAARVRAVPRLRVPRRAEDRSVSIARFLGAHRRSRTTVPGELHRDAERFAQSLEATQRRPVATCPTPISTRDGPRRAANIRSPTRLTTNCWTSSLPAASPACPGAASREPRRLLRRRRSIARKGAGRGKAIGEDPAPTGVAHRDADLVNR